ncbi:ribonuclease H-like domain-containing protein [Candidatus Curtissbacteria bacterium]|nr:ribonuclease H-like domain-containing protein [Candidatus Curtissbacteria bacterium]
MNLYFDIETIPADESLKDTIVELERKREKKREATEAAGNGPRDRREKSGEMIYRATSLSGDFGRIFCIGYAIGDDPVDVVSGDELAILKKWWDIADRADLFVGHNIMDFDLPFIYKRSIIYKIKPAARHLNMSFARYRSDPIYDTMKEWDKWALRASISLDKLAKVLGLPTSKVGMDGSKVYDAYLKGKYDEIYEYCKRDVELTREVFKRMNFQK